MFILAGTCVFLGIVLGIMGLMAWGAMTTQPPTDEPKAEASPTFNEAETTADDNNDE